MCLALIFYVLPESLALFFIIRGELVIAAEPTQLRDQSLRGC